MVDKISLLLTGLLVACIILWLSNMVGGTTLFMIVLLVSFVETIKRIYNTLTKRPKR